MIFEAKTKPVGFHYPLKNITPDIINTDLDGRLSDLILSNKRGTIVIIHAHGDNLEAINQHFSSFPGVVMGTTQNRPLSHVQNYGGFTDGDRCIFLATKMEAAKIFLFGFDFGNIIGKYSKPNLRGDELANESKLRKLQWAQKLISKALINKKSLLYKVNGDKVKLTNVKNLNFAQLLELLDDFV